MTRGELVRLRRCRLLELAMLFGVLIPVFSPGWITIGAAVVGEAVLGVTWWRNCRRERTGGARQSSGASGGKTGGE